MWKHVLFTGCTAKKKQRPKLFPSANQGVNLVNHNHRHYNSDSVRLSEWWAFLYMFFSVFFIWLSVFFPCWYDKFIQSWNWWASNTPTIINDDEFLRQKLSTSDASAHMNTGGTCGILFSRNAQISELFSSGKCVLNCFWRVFEFSATLTRADMTLMVINFRSELGM